MKKKKALIVTTVSGFVPQFEMNNILILQRMGFEVHYAANYNTPSYGNDNKRLEHTGIIQHQIDFVRSPFSLKNIHAYAQLQSLMKNEHFVLIHCHTPMGGVLARLAAHFTHSGPIIYTAHGFHFYQGSPIHNWLFYYPIERILSYFTTQLICINQEDFARAKKSFHAKYINYIPGVGLDFKKIPIFSLQQKLQKKQELKIPLDSTILLSSGELIKRKNHETIIRSLAKLRQKYSLNNIPFPNIRYVICGHGRLANSLSQLAHTLNVSDLVMFLGYRTDMLELYQIADIFIFPSYQEGLPFSLLEAMASRLPIICSNIRGNRDLMGNIVKKSLNLDYCKNGIMVSPANCVDAYSLAIAEMLSHQELFSYWGNESFLASQNFSLSIVSQIMSKIYERLTPKNAI